MTRTGRSPPCFDQWCILCCLSPCPEEYPQQPEGSSIMRVHDLRRKYIEFFQNKGHLYQPASPLVPIDALGVEDKSTLFTSAGMQQYKPYFTGAATPPSTRICTVQKCLRTGDIDSVGDYSHCTLFEMLGNFSFGDYFKKEVITWTWEFLTDVLKLDKDRFCV